MIEHGPPKPETSRNQIHGIPWGEGWRWAQFVPSKGYWPWRTCCIPTSSCPCEAVAPSTSAIPFALCHPIGTMDDLWYMSNCWRVKHCQNMSKSCQTIAATVFILFSYTALPPIEYRWLSTFFKGSETVSNNCEWPFMTSYLWSHNLFFWGFKLFHSGQHGTRWNTMERDGTQWGQLREL